MRDDEDTMDNWDEDKLKEVVEKKHGEGDKQRPTTDIVSDHQTWVFYHCIRIRFSHLCCTVLDYCGRHFLQPTFEKKIRHQST